MSVRVKVPDAPVLQAAIAEYEKSHPVDHPRCEECLQLGKAMAFSELFVERQQSLLRGLLFLAGRFRADEPLPRREQIREELEQYQIMMMKMCVSYGLYAAAILEKEDDGKQVR